MLGINKQKDSQEFKNLKSFVQTIEQKFFSPLLESNKNLTQLQDDYEKLNKELKIPQSTSPSLIKTQGNAAPSLKSEKPSDELKERPLKSKKLSYELEEQFQQKINRELESLLKENHARLTALHAGLTAFKALTTKEGLPKQLLEQPKITVPSIPNDINLERLNDPNNTLPLRTYVEETLPEIKTYLEGMATAAEKLEEQFQKWEKWKELNKSQKGSKDESPT